MGMSDDEIIFIWRFLTCPKLREAMFHPRPGLGRVSVPVEPFCFEKPVAEVKSCKKMDPNFEFIDYCAIKNAVAGKSFSLAVHDMNSCVRFDDHSHFVIDCKTDFQ